MNLKTQTLLFLEFNEINFEFVERYCAAGHLPNLARVLRENGVQRTTSESSYELLEPWIQWVTAHTGKTFEEHKVFRLGDIVGQDLPQIWEQLEARGLRVGAISPMNAKHRLRDPAFFVPDPWTKTGVSAPPALKRLYNAIAQAVNENATRRVTFASFAGLLDGFLRYAKVSNWPRYLVWAATAAKRRWRGALLLDLLLADVFIDEVRRTRPNFASLFLNAGAHIQHHYMFSSSVYSGPHRNPEWYIAPGTDPVIEVYRLYDSILGAVRKANPEARIMIATGLHQQPFGHLKFYWRLRDHADFLAKLGVRFERVEPLMSRDFLVVCQDEAGATAAAVTLAGVLAADGMPLFEVDNRGKDLFVMLTYPHDIPADSTIRLGSTIVRFRQEVAFVAIKNGEHDGIGYFVDTSHRLNPSATPFPLTSMPSIVTDALLGPAIPKGHPN
jgi:hypothetical protein